MPLVVNSCIIHHRMFDVKAVIYKKDLSIIIIMLLTLTWLQIQIHTDMQTAIPENELHYW